MREELRDHGVTFDISATTYYQGTTSGGLEEGFEFGGRNDYWLNVDGQKAGLWPGFFMTLHGETAYGESANQLTGAIVPVNSRPSRLSAPEIAHRCAVHSALSENSSCTPKINTIDNVQQPFMPAALTLFRTPRSSGTRSWDERQLRNVGSRAAILSTVTQSPAHRL
jgi:porin